MKFFQQHKKIFTFLLLIGFAHLAHAEETLDNTSWLPDRLNLNIFGTLGASYHNEEGLTYRRSAEQPFSVEANKIDFASDSVLGGLARYHFNEQFSSTLQLVTRENAWGNWKPRVINAYVKYAPTDDLQFRFGRVPLDSNFGVETRYAGFAYTNIRPSPEIFGLLASYDKFDGMDAYYRHPLATGIGFIRFNAGKVAGERFISESEYLKHNTTYGVLAGWNKDNFELRLSGTVIDVKNFKGYNQLAANLAALPFADAQARAQEIYDTNDHQINVFAATAEYEINQWKMQAVAGKFKSSSFPTYHGENGLFLLSYRFGNVTPYAMAAYSKFMPESRSLNLPPIPQLSPLVQAYTQVSNILLIDQSTLSLGMRYDINEHHAIKFQVDKINANSSPVITSSRPAGSDQDLTLFSIALDFFY